MLKKSSKTLLIAAIIVLGIVIIVLIVLLVLRRQQDYTQSFTFLQQRISEIQEQVKKSVDDGSKAVGEKFESSLKVIGDIKKTIEELVKMPDKLKMMRGQALNLARPNSAADITKLAEDYI